MKPMIKYRGGKTKEIPHIMWHIPRFSGRYIEPFLGGGALFFHLEPRCAIINDINTKLMGFYKGVRDDYATLHRELLSIKEVYLKNREEFDRLKAIHPEDRVEDKNEILYYELRDMFNGIKNPCFSDALLYFFINKTAYSGMIRYNAKGEFNVPFGRYQNLNIDKVTLSHSQLLQRAKLMNSDYSDVFNIAEADDFMFLDPPYDCVFSDYGNSEYRDGFNEDSHRQLAEDFRNLSCKTLMVIGKTPLTEELYHGYIQEEYDKNYAVNIKNRFKAEAKHIIVTNYRNRWETPAAYAAHNTYTLPESNQVMLFEAQKNYGKDR